MLVSPLGEELEQGSCQSDDDMFGLVGRHGDGLVFLEVLLGGLMDISRGHSFGIRSYHHGKRGFHWLVE